MDKRLVKLIYFIHDALIYTVVLSCISACWVRLEIIIDGVKHTSNVDSIIAMILAYFITKEFLKD